MEIFVTSMQIEIDGQTASLWLITFFFHKMWKTQQEIFDILTY